MKSKLFLTMFAASLALLSVVSPCWAQDDTLPSEVDTASVVAEAETMPSDETANAELSPENSEDWQYQTSLSLPAEEAPAASNLLDVFVPADVFRHSRQDLSDLRLIAVDGSSVPYAVRTLAARDVMEYQSASEFNRSEPEDGIHEVTLEFSADEPTHNQVVIETSGEEFRRSVVIEGSDDGMDWKKLARGHLINLTADGKSYIQKEFRYRESRHRFLRVQVTPDLQLMTSESGKDEFKIDSVQVSREISIPAVLVTTDAEIGSREPTRQYGSPGSRWILDFGAEIPVDRLVVSIKDQEFVRDVSLEAETVNLIGQREFYPVLFNETSTWQRQNGDEPKAFTVTFSEVRTRRLRLIVADYRNKPLTLTSVKGSAPARQIVLQRPEASQFPLVLRFGNPDAESPNYDFARNLPEALPSTPVRAVLGAAEPNTAYVAPPIAFTERFPWFIYVALSSVSVALGAVVMNLSKAAIASHDAASDKA
ncbi:MAG: DUF3999 family protein [Planctomycetaceae bacterium]